jgi:hypothetical protein
MRAAGVRGLLIYCSDFKCSHWTVISGDRWPDDVRLSDIEPRFTCQTCGQKGADVRPNFNWEKEARARSGDLRNSKRAHGINLSKRKEGRIVRAVCPSRNNFFVPSMEQRF